MCFALKIADSPVKGEAYSRLLADMKSDDQFQLYNCTKPSAKFEYFLDPNEGEDYSGCFGQLRNSVLELVQQRYESDKVTWDLYREKDNV